LARNRTRVCGSPPVSRTASNLEETRVHGRCTCLQRPARATFGAALFVPAVRTLLRVCRPSDRSVSVLEDAALSPIVCASSQLRSAISPCVSSHTNSHPIYTRGFPRITRRIESRRVNCRATVPRQCRAIANAYSRGSHHRPFRGVHHLVRVGTDVQSPRASLVVRGQHDPRLGHETLASYFDRKRRTNYEQHFSYACFGGNFGLPVDVTSRSLSVDPHQIGNSNTCATSIAAGAAQGPVSGSSWSGTLWVTGCTKYSSGGFDVYAATDGGPFMKQNDPPNQAIVISADTVTGDLTAITGSNDIYFGTSSSPVTWTEAGGCAHWVADCNNDIFNTVAIGCNHESSGGFNIDVWNGDPDDPGNGQWSEIGGQAVRIAANQSGQLWVTNALNNIYTWSNPGSELGSWQKAPGCGISVGVDANNNAWVVGCTSTASNGNGLFVGGLSGWTEVSGTEGAMQVSIDSTGNPWTLDSEGHIFFWSIE
jgi:hypothetical protein